MEKILNDCFKNCFFPHQDVFMKKMRKHIGECSILEYSHERVLIQIAEKQYHFEIGKSVHGISIIKEIVAF